MKNDLEERLIDFAVRIINLAESLPKTKIGNHICGQMMRSGTSPAPNYEETQDAESRSDSTMEQQKTFVFRQLSIVIQN